MRINHIRELEGLFDVIDKCKGRVDLIGPDIQLNLKSKISQYFSLAKIFSGGEEIEELELIAHDYDDIKLLLDYMIGHKD